MRSLSTVVPFLLPLVAHAAPAPAPAAEQIENRGLGFLSGPNPLANPLANILGGPNAPAAPVANPATQPVAAQPVAAQPVAAQPVAAQPVAAAPVAPVKVASDPLSGVVNGLVGGTTGLLGNLLQPAQPLVSPVIPILKTTNCVVNNLLNGLANDAIALPYCSSILSIFPTLTASVGITVRPTLVSTIQLPKITATVKLGKRAAADVTRTTTVLNTVTATVTQTTSTVTISCLDAAYTAPVKRDLEERDPLLGLLGNPAPAGQPAVTAGVTVGLGVPGVATPSVVLSVSIPLPTITSACGCLNIPKPSVTSIVTPTIFAGNTVTSYVTVAASTVTVTASAAAAANTIVSTVTQVTTTTAMVNVIATQLSNPNGLKWRKFTHSFSAYTNDPDNQFTSSFFKTAAVDLTGNSPNAQASTDNWPSGGWEMTLGGQTWSAEQSGIIFQGFYVARQAGNHVFSSSGDTIDNWGLLWTGQNAYKQYADGNVAFQSTRVDYQPYTGGSTTLAMKAGDAVPITWLWANGGGAGNSDLKVTTPDGNSSGGDGNFVPACSASTFA